MILPIIIIFGDEVHLLFQDRYYEPNEKHVEAKL